MSDREIICDTETTGLRYQDGHRIIEIAALEMIDNQLTGRKFHTFINPQRSIPAELASIHSITDETVADAPLFRQVMGDFLEFIRGAKLVAHNADFDAKFLDNEMTLGGNLENIWSVVGEVVDTLPMSRRIWVGKDPVTTKGYRHRLDDILDRLQIDRSERTVHGALIDTELLASAYIGMKQLVLDMGPTIEDDIPRGPIVRLARTGILANLPRVMVSSSSRDANEALMGVIRPEPGIAVVPARPKM